MIKRNNYEVRVIDSNPIKSMVVKILIWILRSYDPTYPKRSGSFKDLCNHLGSVGLYDSNNPK